MNSIKPTLSVPFSFLLAVIFSLPGLALAEDKKALKFTPEQIGIFEKEVQPVLENRCYKCHGDRKKVKGSLRLISRASELKGGQRRCRREYE